MVDWGSRVWVKHVACLLALIALTGCNDDTINTPVAAASSRDNSSSGNTAPVISGKATASVAVGTSFAFAPTAADADGNSLSFTITNKPAWATFNAVTGKLTGTPTAGDVGTYSNILIRVSDGTVTSTLPDFTVVVTQIGTGSVNLSWLPPTENTDGSQLVDLAGYNIYYGTSASALDLVTKVDNASINRYLIDNLSPATWYFSITAFNSSGLESSRSAVASKTIG